MHGVGPAWGQCLKLWLSVVLPHSSSQLCVWGAGGLHTNIRSHAWGQGRGGTEAQVWVRTQTPGSAGWASSVSRSHYKVKFNLAFRGLPLI